MYRYHYVIQFQLGSAHLMRSKKGWYNLLLIVVVKEFAVLSFVGIQTRLEMSAASPPPPPELAAYLKITQIFFQFIRFTQFFCHFVCFLVFQNTQISTKHIPEAPLLQSL